MTTWREALTSTGAESQTRVQAQSWVIPNVFNVGNVAKRLIWTRMDGTRFLRFSPFASKIILVGCIFLLGIGSGAYISNFLMQLEAEKSRLADEDTAVLQKLIIDVVTKECHTPPSKDPLSTPLGEDDLDATSCFMAIADATDLHPTEEEADNVSTIGDAVRAFYPYWKKKQGAQNAPITPSHIHPPTPSMH